MQTNLSTSNSASQPIREASLELLATADHLRTAAERTPFDTAEAMHLLRLARLAEDASTALQERYRIMVTHD